MGIEKGILRRTQLLLGDTAMDRIGQARVIIFGVGGVGSWCAESLVRSGVRHLTIVDSDRVCITNINRQLMATVETVGQVKVEALRAR
ncbi:MAG: ThiF family adenylyltransferase, partial [Prevotella sp.]|nr:ThiF family adenylyltransferase [Prevotella sp.]